MHRILLNPHAYVANTPVQRLTARPRLREASCDRGRMRRPNWRRRRGRRAQGGRRARRRARVRRRAPQLAQRSQSIAHKVADRVQLRERAGVLRARHVRAAAHAPEQAGRRHAHLRPPLFNFSSFMRTSFMFNSSGPVQQGSER